jgi:putative thiamine transport system substrate-binding protein
MHLQRLGAGLMLGLGLMAASHATDWTDTVSAARGETVFFNAWGGSEVINDYLEWVRQSVSQQYEIELRHVKVADTADVVSRVLAERAAGRVEGGSVDLIWINGENFRSMQEQGLLLPPWTDQLPNYALLDHDNKPTLRMDFSTPVNHQEAPWGMAQLTFMYDSARLDEPPQSMHALLRLAQAHPGRITYPALPSFYGTTFLKQAMLELSETPELFYLPMSEVDDVAAVLAPLWHFLDELHAVAWQQGRSFPRDAQQMMQMLDDGDLLISLTFNPFDVANAIVTGQLPDTVRPYIHEDGTIANTHFVAIPFNASAPAAAQVVANFLMSPEAQARKADITVWGDPTVLNMQALNAEQRVLFANPEAGLAVLSDADLGNVRLEPHASWVGYLEQQWQQRYAR